MFKLPEPSKDAPSAHSWRIDRARPRKRASRRFAIGNEKKPDHGAKIP
jgi:hypothetical protein